MKLAKYILIIFSLLLLTSCKDKQKKETKKEVKKEVNKEQLNLDFIKNYAGNIEDELDLHLNLKSENGIIKGKYFYDNVGTDIELKGNISKDSTVILNEFDTKGNQTGLWTGKLINENKIKGVWSKPNGSSEKGFTLILTSDNYIGMQKSVKEKITTSENSIRIGKHMFTLQWIGYKTPGSVMITKKDDKSYYVKGQQLSKKNNDYLKIDGILTPLTQKELVFNGTIRCLVSHNNKGQECVKKGSQVFKASGKRKYWRLQNMTNCEGGRLTDYVDIFFD